MSQLKTDQQWCERTPLSFQEDTFVTAVNFYNALISQLYQDKLQCIIKLCNYNFTGVWIDLLKAYSLGMRGMLVSTHLSLTCNPEQTEAEGHFTP